MYNVYIFRGVCSGGSSIFVNPGQSIKLMLPQSTFIMPITVNIFTYYLVIWHPPIKTSGANASVRSPRSSPRYIIKVNIYLKIENFQ